MIAEKVDARWAWGVELFLRDDDQPHSVSHEKSLKLVCYSLAQIDKLLLILIFLDI